MLAGAAMAMLAAPLAHAQVQTIDPNSAIDSDLDHASPVPQQPAPYPPARAPMPSAPPTGAPMAAPTPGDAPYPAQPAGAPYTSQPYASQPYGAAQGSSGGPVGGPSAPSPSGDATYHENELVNAAEGVFGKGARGLALMIRDLLKKQGEPDAYITGNEGGGAVVVGLRYGSGTLHHKIEGQMPIYWTGPSVGFDFGGSGGSTFVLIYNLHDTETLFQRIAAGEGQAYLLGGFNVSYMRKGDLVVIPVRMGAGLRLGVNGGYLRFSHTQKWVPF